MTYHEGDILFEDRFDGGSVESWRIPPISLTDYPVCGGCYFEEASDVC